METLKTWDDRVVGRVAAIDHGAFAPVLRGASRATDYSLLWAAVAGALALFGGPPGRRAALQGWVAIGVNSLLIGHPLKAAVRRERPDADLIPDARRPEDITTTHSFPSGHTGSAVAFTVAASAAWPLLAPLLAPVALVVAYARLYVGLHHPSDLFGGALVGGLAGAAVRRWGPRQQ